VAEQLDLLAEAREARDEGMARTTNAAGDDEITILDAAIARMARSGDVFSANDIRSDLDGVRGPLVGARFNSARMRGLISPVSYTPSTDPGTHCHPIRTWQGTAKARGEAVA
jgi:hypothetical protein